MLLPCDSPPTPPAAVQGVLNWVAQPRPGQEPPSFEARLYDVLFCSQNPAAADDWLADLNPHSLEVVTGAYANPVLAAAAMGDRWVGSVAWEGPNG